jgi:hypothetical protein
MRSNLSPSSPLAHVTFCTLDDVLRPQIFIIDDFSLRHGGGHVSVASSSVVRDATRKKGPDASY